MKYSEKVKKETYSKDNEATLVNGGNDFFERLEKIINEAKQIIFFQTYIFSEDETGTHIQQALIRASKRNVKVYLLVDAFGSASLSKNFINEITSSGIAFRFYGKLFVSGSFHIGRRLHHKIVVADGFNSLVGGINIADKYNTLHGHLAWLDFAVECKGPVSQKLHLICMRKWQKKNISRDLFATRELFLQSYVNFENTCMVGARENDSWLNKHQVSESYKRIFDLAEEEIIVVGAYFIPGFTFRKKMAKAVKRGVRVRIVTGAKSDVLISKYARQYLYSWLLRKGIEIYEYQKSVVHAKVAVVDKQWATLGSYDLNNLSASGNIEMNLDILNNQFAENFHNLLLKLIANDSIQISIAELDKKNTLINKLKMWFSYRIVRILFWFSEILVNERRKK